MPSIHIVQSPPDHLAAWLTFIGALTVALIAATTAQLRLRTQLAAEEARLVKQLEAEDKRHLDQLAFQRGETDREELRRILDDLAQHVFALQEASSDAVAAAQTAAANWDEENANLDYWRARFESISERIDTEVDKASRQIERVRLRLGDSGMRLVELAHLIRMRASSVGYAFIRDPPWTPKKLAEAEDSRKRLNELCATFSAEALKFTRAELHQPAHSEVDGAT